MKYMVMECHLSYAVVLGENGRFLKVANRQYEVGQTVTDVIEMQVPQSAPRKNKVNQWIYSVAAMAACLMLVVTAVFQMGQMTYASVYLTINPKVRIDVNRKDVVIGLDSVNTDGDDLIEGYVYQKKNLDLVMDELIDRAIDMGYLHEGGQISLVLDADNDEWVVSHRDTLTSHLNAHLNEKLTVTIEVTNMETQSDQVVIPVVPGESSYGESDYGEDTLPTQPEIDSAPAVSDYDGSEYDDGQTDYGESDDYTDGQSEYGTDNDNHTDYEDPDEHDNGQSEYASDNYVEDDDQPDDSDFGDDDDGQSEYGPDDDDDNSWTDYADWETGEEGLSDYYDDQGGSDYDSDDGDD